MDAPPNALWLSNMCYPRHQVSAIVLLLIGRIFLRPCDSQVGMERIQGKRSELYETLEFQSRVQLEFKRLQRHTWKVT